MKVGSVVFPQFTITPVIFFFPFIYHTHQCIIYTEIDPKLKESLNAAQYIAQYLDAGKDMLLRKKNVIEKGIDIFDEEEQSLDFEISKYR